MYQRLTANTGYPKLRQHLGQVAIAGPHDLPDFAPEQVADEILDEFSALR